MTLASSPRFLLLLVFGLCLALAIVGPVIQEPPVSWYGVGQQLGLMAAFCFAYGVANRTVSWRGAPSIAALPAASWIWIFLCIGIAGTCLQLASKLSSMDSIGLEGFAVLRQQRAEQLLLSQPAVSARWAGLGFLAYPAGIVGCCAVLRCYEDMRGMHVLLVLVFLAGLVALTVVAGGRGPLFAAAAVLVSTLALRKLDGRRAVPPSLTLRYIGIISALGFIAYSMMLWSVRSELSAMDAERFLSNTEGAWGMSVRPEVRNLLEPLVGLEGLRMMVLSSFYLSQSFSVFERVASAPELPIMLGLYEVDALAAGYRVIVGADAGLLATGNWALLDLKVYGFFAGAWGSLVIDFGFSGAIAAALAWGWFAGRSWGAAARCPGMPVTFMLPYWCASSLWSFASSPIGFSNAAVLLGWFVVAVACIGRLKRSQATAAGSI